MLTDPIANFLTRIRNASAARRKELTVRSSNMIKALTQVLLDNKFIEKFEEHPSQSGNIQEITIVLRSDREPLELKRISKPGQRIYIGHKEVRRVRNGLGIAIISTSSGLLSDAQAHKNKIGGEYICEVY